MAVTTYELTGVGKGLVCTITRVIFLKRKVVLPVFPIFSKYCYASRTP